MFWIDFGGCERSSRTTRVNFRPSTPPAALTSSIAACKPKNAPAWPLSAEGEADEIAVEAQLDVLGLRRKAEKAERCGAEQLVNAVFHHSLLQVRFQASSLRARRAAFAT